MEKFRDLFVYGTIKQGGKWHHLLQGQKFLGTACVQGDMYMHEDGYYPVLHPGKGSVQGEVYSTGETAFNDVRDLESGAGYQCARLRTDSGNEVYVFLSARLSNQDPSTRITDFDASSFFQKWLGETPTDHPNYRSFIDHGGVDPREIRQP